jgi:hypothetical protein
MLTCSLSFEGAGGREESAEAVELRGISVPPPHEAEQNQRDDTFFGVSSPLCFRIRTFATFPPASAVSEADRSRPYRVSDLHHMRRDSRWISRSGPNRRMAERFLHT